MKNFFRITGWILFALITVLLVLDYWGIDMYDTCLFSLNGNSVGLQSADVFDLSPTIMKLIYFIILAINIVSLFKKIDHLVLAITNFILAIPVFLVLNPYMLEYPPFGNTECFVTSIFAFLLFIYLSVLVPVGLVLWNFIIRINHKIKHNRH